jgi:hypothetical protein
LENIKLINAVIFYFNLEGAKNSAEMSGEPVLAKCKSTEIILGLI